MKQANNNQVDLLLRSLARRRDESALQNRSGSGDGNRATSHHLDADELNSYAEGVAPAPARARYTEHLADCDVCRRIVVGLTSAAGAATRSDAPQQKGGFWQKLASLFSPAVLRYAVPALVLTAVIGISLLAMWQQRPQSEFIAKNQPAGSSTSSGQLGQTESRTSQPTSEAPPTMQKRSESPVATDSFKEENKLRDDRARDNQAAGTGTGEGARGALTAKDAGQPEESTSRVELRPSYAPEPKAAAPPPPAATTLGEAEKSTQLARDQPAKREDQERQRDLDKNTPTDEHGPNRSAAPRTAEAPASNRRLDLSTGRGGPSKDGKKDKAGEVETRLVSGKRFAREGNSWVDTAYDSSRTPIKVARGTEQFRALVADEPELRVIAEQLNGVVIVVWRNRAYRIQ